MQPLTPPIRPIYEYLDFRELLRDRCSARKRQNRSFSYRYLAGKVGLDSGTLSRILKGGRNLDPEMAGRFARVLGLNESESQYFETLVLFGQAKSQAEKNLSLEKLFRMQGSKANVLEERQFIFYKEWYHLAMRELLNFYPFDGDYRQLAKMLRPAIRPLQAKKALRLLSDIGLVKREESGRFRLTERFITSGDNIQALFLNNLHQSMAELAARSLPNIQPGERDFSGLTFSLSPEGLKKVKAKSKEFRRDLLEIAQQDRNVDCVYRMNLQLFPLSNAYKQKER
jgi:uncharacterized protein (TIGR02147 family)